MLEKQTIDLEKAVLIGVINQQQPEEKVMEYLEELAFLTFTAGGEVVKKFLQRIDPPNPKTFIGTGKMEEVEAYVRENEISAVIFDDELTPAQQKNIERQLRCKILDRTGLILDIFAQRAKPATPAPRWNSHNTNTCSRDLRAYGRTWSVSGVVSACADPGKLKLKPTAGLCVTG